MSQRVFVGVSVNVCGCLFLSLINESPTSSSVIGDGDVVFLSLRQASADREGERSVSRSPVLERIASGLSFRWLSGV